MGGDWPRACCHLPAPPEAGQARLCEPLQATSAQRTETALEAYGEKKNSEVKPSLARARGTFHLQELPLPRTECGESGPAAKERVLPLSPALPPRIPQQPAALRTASRKRKSPIDSWGVGWCQWQGLVADGKFFSLKRSWKIISVRTRSGAGDKRSLVSRAAVGRGWPSRALEPYACLQPALNRVTLGRLWNLSEPPVSSWRVLEVWKRILWVLDATPNSTKHYII